MELLPGVNSSGYGQIRGELILSIKPACYNTALQQAFVLASTLVLDM